MMTELTLKFDHKASESINALMKHYKTESKADLITKAISVLKIIAYVDETHGELLARKGQNETKIVIR